MRIHQVEMAGLFLEEDDDVLYITQMDDVDASLALQTEQIDGGRVQASMEEITIMTAILHYCERLNASFELSCNTATDDEGCKQRYYSVICNCVVRDHDESIQEEVEDRDTALITALEWLRRMAS